MKEELKAEDIVGYLPYVLETCFKLSDVMNVYKDEVRNKLLTEENLDFVIKYCKPKLIPLHSLTPDQLVHFSICFRLWYDKPNFDYKQMIYQDIETCHKLHVDYRGLIEKGLAIKK